MLEFYPMPTNLNHGNGLYGLHHHHHQNHGGARFLDNPNVPTTNTQQQQQQLQMTAASTLLNCNNNSGSPNNNQSNATVSVSANCTIQQQQQTSAAINSEQQQQQTTLIATVAAACNTLPDLNATNNNNSNTNNNLCLSPASAIAINTSSSSSSSSSSSACPSTASTATATSPALSLSSASTTSATSASSAVAASLTTAIIASPSKLSADCNGRTEVGHIKCEKNFEICEGCGQKIHDRYLMNVADANWHEQCLHCCYCGMQLHQTCYVRNGKIYCKIDYDRLFSVKCVACCHPILPQEMVMRPIPNLNFHLSCFMCYACRLPLQKGEQFLLREGQLFCFRHDLEKEMYLAAAAAAQHCGFVGLDDDDLLRPRDGRRGPKRPRTILTSQQRKQFKASFDQSPKPCRKVREALAKDTGLSVRVVQVWFQNQRAKMKKIQRKAKNGNANGRNGGAGNANNNDDKDMDKDEKGIKQESGSGSENGYLGMDSAYASQPLNPNLPFSPDDYPANSNDSFCSSDLSLDGSNFDQLDDDTDSLSLNNLELHSSASSGHQHATPHDMLANLNTSLINPIDKLYLMQNSYFSSEQ